MRTAVVFSPPCHGVSLAFASGVGGLTAPLCVSLGFANGVDPARVAVVVSLPCCGFPLRSQTVCVQRGRRWCSHRLCWPMVAMAGFVRACAGSNSGSGHLAASRSASACVTSGGGDDVAVSLSAPCLAHRERLQWLATC